MACLTVCTNLGGVVPPVNGTATDLRRSLKHESKAICFLVVNDQLLVCNGVSERYIPTVPEPFLGTLIHLVSRPISRHFSLELRKIEQYIAQQAAHRILSVEALRNGYEFDATSVKEIHELMEIANGTGQTINLVGKDAVQPAFPYVAEHLLQCRTVQGIR